MATRAKGRKASTTKQVKKIKRRPRTGLVDIRRFEQEVFDLEGVHIAVRVAEGKLYSYKKAYAVGVGETNYPIIKTFRDRLRALGVKAAVVFHFDKRFNVIRTDIRTIGKRNAEISVHDSIDVLQWFIAKG